MLKFTNYSIVFQEVPDEITLAINLSNCPNRCKGCHSPYLRENIGEDLNETVLTDILSKYRNEITCVCFMGGDAEPQEVARLSNVIKQITNKTIKTAWYSGKDKLPENQSIESFNYIKLGQYQETLGGLRNKTTNQHFYQIENNQLIDKTFLFSR